MNDARVVRLGSYALAVWILLSVAFAIIGLPNLFSFVQPLDGWIQIEGETLAFVLFPGLPLVIIARALTTNSPADIALVGFAVPCFLTSLWALYRYFTHSGVYWGGLFMVLTGTMLALVVLGDALLARTVRTPA